MVSLLFSSPKNQSLSRKVNHEIMRRFLFFRVILIGLSLNGLWAQTNPSESPIRVVSPKMSPDNSEALKQLPFKLFVPVNDAGAQLNEQISSKRLLIFLHGSGERGSDNKAQLTHGKTFFERLAKDQNTLVLVPQCPELLSWHNGYSQNTKHGRKYHYPKKRKPNHVLDLLERLIDSVALAEQIDSRNILVGGLSMGGMGTLELLRRRPNFYARAFVICGGAHPAIARQIGQTPIWFFHGLDDDIVVPKYARKIYRKLNRKGINTKLTLYPGVHHNSWDLAFEDQELIPWLMD